MYIDVIQYKLSKKITEEHLFEVAKDVVENWMSKQNGFIKWDIHQNIKGGYTDIVYWETEEDAKKATKEMVNIPNSKAWYDCYEKGSISSNNLKSLVSFG